MTHTYVVMEISDAAYAEIKENMLRAGYTHAFDGDNIDMHGIAVARMVASLNASQSTGKAEWVYDPVAASKDARTHSRPKNAPPHWVRCDFVRDGVRCVKGEGHEKGVGEAAKHAEPK